MKELNPKDPRIDQILPEGELRPNIRYIRSQFVIQYHIEGQPVLLNVFTKQCLITELEDRAYASDEILGNDALTELVKGYFLVPEDYDEVARYMKTVALINAITHREGHDHYTVIVTSACNARCVYCFEEGVQYRRMSDTTADQTVDYMLRTRREGCPVRITWFGGEPLMGTAVIDRICRKIAEAGVDYETDMISNGSLVTEEIVERMKGLWKLGIIQITMDGNEKAYIERKRFYQYDDTYMKTIRGIELIAASGIRVDVRVNVDYDNIDTFPELLDDLARMIEHKEKVCVYLSPLYQVRDSENDLAIWKRIIDYSPLIREKGFTPLTMGGFYLVLRNKGCKAQDKNAVIDQDGILYQCQHYHKESIVGNVVDGITDEAALKEFTRTDRVLPKCAKCPFLPDCTTFISCPIKDRHCRERYTLMTENGIRNMLKRKEPAALAEC